MAKDEEKPNPKVDKEEEEEKSKGRYILKEVVTQKDTAIGDSSNDNVFTDKGILLEILNKLDKIEKAVA